MSVPRLYNVTPRFAVALVCVSVQNHGGSCSFNRPDLTPSASAKKFGHEGNCRGSSVFRLPSIFFSSRHLRIRVAQNSFAPGAAGGRRAPVALIGSGPNGASTVLLITIVKEL